MLPKLRRTTRPEVIHLQQFITPWVGRYFEFMKRAGVVAALALAKTRVPFLAPLYWISIGALVYPLWATLDQHRFDFELEADAKPLTVWSARLVSVLIEGAVGGGGAVLCNYAAMRLVEALLKTK